MQTGKHGVRTYGQASIGIPSVPESPETKRRPLQAAYAQRPKEPPGPSDDPEPAGQPPQLSAQQQSDLAAIENYARHFGLEQEGLIFAYEQAGLPPPTEEQKQAAERGLPLRPEQSAKTSSPSNHGGFYLGETSQ
jgi:hypothetical protein